MCAYLANRLRQKFPVPPTHRRLGTERDQLTWPTPI
jgi:hypothetical protein